MSVRAIDLKSYGWKHPWHKDYYLNKQFKEISTNTKLMYSAKTYDEMDITIDKANLKDEFPLNVSHERIAVYNNKNNQFISTFYHIRNSLAHCRFNIQEDEESNDWFFIFEDGIKSKEKFKLSARMVLRLSTLLAWIKLIEGGEQKYNNMV